MHMAYWLVSIASSSDVYCKFNCYVFGVVSIYIIFVPLIPLVFALCFVVFSLRLAIWPRLQITH